MTKLARSLGPRRLARVLKHGGSLNHPDDSVTFLEVIEDGTNAKAASQMDVWDYGGGRELGVFVLVETGELVLHSDALPSHGHDPNRHPGHVYVHNDESTLDVDVAVLVENPNELAAAARCSSTDEAHRVLTRLRDGEPLAAVAERVAAKARELTAETADLARTLENLRKAHRENRDLGRTLERMGLDPRLLEIHPEHMPAILRRAVATLEQALDNNPTEV